MADEATSDEVLDRGGCNRIVGVERIVDHGPDADRWNVVVIAEGYRETELEAFAEHAQGFTEALFGSDPFFTLGEAINVHRLDVASCGSGADHPPADGDGCIEVDTFFDASHCVGLPRLLVVDQARVFAVLDRHVPDWDVAMVVVNSPIRGGSGAQDVAVVALGAGQDPTQRNSWGIALHELGHSAFGLADEYDFHHPPYERRSDCDDPSSLPTDDLPRYERYEGDEPLQANVTVASSWGDVPWRHLIDRDAELPTVAKDDCIVSHWCTTRNPAPHGTVGLFEGAFYHRCGVYRSQFNCRMNMSGTPFCAVCQEHIRRDLAPRLVQRIVGRPIFLRAHQLGGGYGPSHDRLDVEVVVRLDQEPDRAFGFQLRRDAHEGARRAMLDTLRAAFEEDREVRLGFRGTGLDNGMLVEVEAS